MTTEDEALREARKQVGDMYLASHLEKHEMERQTAETALDNNMERLAAHQSAHDQAHNTHLQQHKAEAQAVQTALDAKALRDDDHRLSHEQYHTAHATLHETVNDAHASEHAMEQLAVTTALAAVARERTIHADAHEREHIAHIQVHELAQRAVDKAENAVEARLHTMNEVRDQLREQATTFVQRDVFDAFATRYEKAHDEVLAQIAMEREERRANEGTRKGISQSTAVIVGAIGLAATIISIVIVVANFLTGTP